MPREWFYLKFQYHGDFVFDPADKRIADRMEKIPFFLEADAMGLGSFIVSKLGPGITYRIERSEFRDQ